MSAETVSSAAEPLVDPNRLGASLDRVNRLVMPVREPVLRGAQYGETLSRLRGQGMERDGVRDYEPGDDPRYIDWKLTARSPGDVPKLRQHHKEITPNLWLATDLAQRRNCSTPGAAFMEQELALSATLAMLLLAQKESMPTGLAAINDDEMVQSPTPAMGTKNVFNMSQQLTRLTEVGYTAANGNEQHLGSMLKRLATVATENMVVLVSDFRDAAPDDGAQGWAKPVQQLRHNGNSIVAIETTNPWDYEIPTEVDRLQLAGKTVHLGGKEGQRIREAYRETALEQQAAIDEALRGVAHVKLSTEDPRWFTSLRTQLERENR